MAPYLKSIIDAVGNTPLVRMQSLNKGLKPTILMKVESLNPGGSIKDRIGLAMVEEAERKGLLKPGGTIVEPTSGNTGVGLAMVAALRGYKTIFVMPDKMAREKIALLEAYGARVVITPTNVPKDSPESYYSVADRITRETPGAFQPNQYANPSNPRAHYLTTGPEIWRQTEGKLDVLVAGIGTGGTITGTGRYLKEKNPEVIVVGADPLGSIYSGEVAPYRVEGVGEDFFPKTYDASVLDLVIQVTDQDAFTAARRLAREEGILAGGSSGMAVHAAIQIAHALGRDITMVVILPDTGRNYLSRFFQDSWMTENGFDTQELPASQPPAQPGTRRGPDTDLSAAVPAGSNTQEDRNPLPGKRA